MRTNIVLDQELVEEAQKLTGERTKRKVVHLALEELVARRKRRNLLDLAGRLELRSGYDHKKIRALRP